MIVIFKRAARCRGRYTGYGEFVPPVLQSGKTNTHGLENSGIQPAEFVDSADIDALVSMLFGFGQFPVQDERLRRSSDGQFLGDDEDAGRVVGLDEITEVGGHRTPVVGDQYSVLVGAQTKNLTVGDAKVQTHHRRSLKIHRTQTHGRSQDVFVQIVVRLEPDLHSVCFDKCSLIRSLRAAPFGKRRAVSRSNSSSVASS